jgi:predicted AAA+ superfamily ATPase
MRPADERRGAATTYVRTPSGREVDFLARFPTGAPVLIQVCADPTAAETAAREFQALAEASALHPRAERLLLTLAHDRVPAQVPAGIRVLPAYEWLISGAA